MVTLTNPQWHLLKEIYLGQRTTVSSRYRPLQRLIELGLVERVACRDGTRLQLTNTGSVFCWREFDDRQTT